MQSPASSQCQDTQVGGAARPYHLSVTSLISPSPKSPPLPPPSALPYPRSTSVRCPCLYLMNVVTLLHSDYPEILYCSGVNALALPE